MKLDGNAFAEIFRITLNVEKRTDNDVVVTTNMEYAECLQLPINGHQTNIYECINGYLDATSFIDENEAPYTFHKTIAKTPEYLILQLGRMVPEVDKEKTIQFFHNLELSEFTTQECKDSSAYELAAIIVHQGSKYAGHYIIGIKLTDDKWYCCNDHVVEQVDLELEDLWKTAYILMYKRIDQN